MATFIDFAKPLEGQINRIDEDEEFKLIRRTKDGKGGVWRELEEDETFTTAGAPPSVDALFGAFEDFVERRAIARNPTRFTAQVRPVSTPVPDRNRTLAEKIAALDYHSRELSRPLIDMVDDRCTSGVTRLIIMFSY